MSIAESIEQVAQRAAERAVAEALSKFSVPASEYLTTQQAAVYLSLSSDYLEIARHKADGSGPEYVKLPRAVRYRRTDLDEWMSRQRVKVR